MTNALDSFPSRPRLNGPAVNVSITPEIAARILGTVSISTMVGHFNIRKVADFTQTMRNREWELSPDPITIDQNGQLAHGKLRLLAVVFSGVTCSFMLTQEQVPPPPETSALSR